MKYFSLLLIVSLTLSAALLHPTSANHRTGSLILPELNVSGDFNQDGKMDLAVNATGFDNVAIVRRACDLNVRAVESKPGGSSNGKRWMNSR